MQGLCLIFKMNVYAVNYAPIPNHIPLFIFGRTAALYSVGRDYLGGRSLYGVWSDRRYDPSLFPIRIIGLWAIFGSEHTSEVVYRLCRLGAILALLLPVVTAFVSLAWATGSAFRPPDLLIGYSALEIPVLAGGIALALILLFFFGSFLAARNIDGVPF